MSWPKVKANLRSCRKIYVRVLAAYYGEVSTNSCVLPILDARSVVRFQADHVNRNLIPAFYRYLQAQEEDKQIEGAKDFYEAIEKLVDMFQKAEQETPEAVGLWKEDGKLGESAFHGATYSCISYQHSPDMALFDRMDRRHGCPLALQNDKCPYSL